MDNGWRKGYTHALRGMITALKMDHSPSQPYILKLKSYDKNQLQEVKEQFSGQIKKPPNTEFDQDYFQAWIDYIYHLLHQLRPPKKKTASLRARKIKKTEDQRFYV